MKCLVIAEHRRVRIWPAMVVGKRVGDVEQTADQEEHSGCAGLRLSPPAAVIGQAVGRVMRGGARRTACVGRWQCGSQPGDEDVEAAFEFGGAVVVG
jgi:hypothetical protein